MSISTFENNQQIITVWVNEYTDSLLKWALHKVGNKPIAEDLVQETFLKAYQSIDSFEGKSQPKTWLMSILNNKIIDHYRSNIRSIISSPNAEDSMVFEASDDLFDDNGGWNQFVVTDSWDTGQHLLDDKHFVKVFESCLGKLPENWQLSVQGKYLLEKDPKIICQELDITPSNYWQILHRAKLLLKKCLESNWFHL
jgi:RNA polymerase sigma-70 factor (TIGR02943 family)